MLSNNDEAFANCGFCVWGSGCCCSRNCTFDDGIFTESRHTDSVVIVNVTERPVQTDCGGASYNSASCELFAVTVHDRLFL